MQMETMRTERVTGMKKLTEHVSYVGVQNPGMRIFDIIMRTEYGTSYNSYVVKGEKTAVIETVHGDYGKEFLENIAEVADINEIDYVILNHTEPDHAGSLVTLLEANPEIEVYGTAVAVRNLKEITNREMKSHIVKTGETLDLGDGVELQFIVAPNLHWPDSMFTYFEKDHVLFSCDVFGSHFCEPEVLDSYVKDPDTLRSERKNYYDCIFGPFKRFVIAGMEKIKDLKIDMICTSHGPVLEKYIEETKKDYEEWSKPADLEKTIAIFYVSAYGYTKRMAEKFKEEFEKGGVKTKLFNLVEDDMNEAVEALHTAKAVLFGSPTINQDALKPVWDLISCTEAIGLKTAKRPALTFGSYGWSGEACRFLDERLRTLKYQVISDGVTCIFKPTAEDEARIAEAAEKMLEAIGE